MICLKFVWRQLGFAFFGALTPVGALFYFERTKEMEEKTLVEGEFSKFNLNPLALICFLIAIIAFITCFVVATEFGGDPSWAFEGIEYGYYWFFIGIAIFITLGVVCMLMKLELTVTDGKVVGKALFGKRVDLPISQISVVGTGIFNRVTIATSSGSINFYGVVNQSEVFSTISELLLKHQNETKVTNSQAPASASDELKKYKDLLDSGIITQEEFDAKKKQLLGL